MILTFFHFLRNGGANPPVVASMITTGTTPDENAVEVLENKGQNDSYIKRQNVR